MKLLFVCQYYYPDQFKINDICEELVREGHDITVLTGLPNYPSGVISKEYKKPEKRKEVINGVTVIRSWLIARGSNNISLSLNYLTFAISATLKVLLLKENFDKVIVYQLSPITMAIPGIILKQKKKIPMILYSFDLWPESIVSGGIENKGVFYSMVLKLSRWIYKRSDKLLVSSNQFKMYFHDVIGYNRDIYHLPIYAEKIFDHIKKADYESFDVVFAGNIGEMQGLETLIDAAKLLKEHDHIKIHIVGDGSARLKIENMAKGHGLDNVIFYGRYPLEDMPRFYDVANAFLVILKDNKSISYTMPGKVQTYMAAGKPIIGSINGETKYTIEDANCGLCSEAEDVDGLAANILSLSHDPELQLKLGNNSREYYEENYSKDKYMKKLQDLIM